jgi:hypothetical protein
MYSTIKLGKTGEDVRMLCNLLGVKERETFDPDLDNLVRGYQKAKGLDPDGVVGFNTWTALIIDRKYNEAKKVTPQDYKTYGDMLGVEPETLMAVVKVETGGSTGFLPSGRPTILFEAHYMYNLLKKSGRGDLEALLTKNPGIISKVWNKSLYKGGEREWNRLEAARKIDEDIADQSTSWGMFQIMGTNYSKCGCSGIREFVSLMETSEYSQFVLGIRFIKNTGLVPYLQAKNWEQFAKKYNGAGYKQNSYDTKLKKAYYDFKNKKTL